MEDKKSFFLNSLCNMLNKDIKELNKIALFLFCISILSLVGIISYKITNSYALFSDSATGNSTIRITVQLPSLDTSGANEPVLSENMIPVYYDEVCDENAGCWRKAEKTNVDETYKWYDYDNKMWANSVTVTETTRNTYLTAAEGTKISMEDVLTMQVWIPRYKYKVWNYNLSGGVLSDPQEIEITFEKGTNSTGEITCADNVQGTSDGTVSGTEALYSEICKLKSNNTECTDEICNNKTYTHPAFTFGNKELTGIWISKFEVSSDITCTVSIYSSVGQGCNLTSIRPLIKPNIKSWYGAMVGTYDYVIRSMNDSDNIYGFLETDDTHMIKNNEWGAMLYLSHSKYGANKKIERNTNNQFLTGCGPQSEGSAASGDICNSYNTTLGKMSSTTGNIYGIYDTNSSTYEYVMGNMISFNGTTMMSGKNAAKESYSGYTGILYQVNTTADYQLYTGHYTYPDNKYINKYTFQILTSRVRLSKLGEGTREMKNNSFNAWYEEINDFIGSENPWIFRNFTYTGLYDGGAQENINTRISITQ